MRRLANAAACGALLLDLATARMAFTRGGYLCARAVRAGFAPADTLLATIDNEPDVNLARLVWHAPAGMNEVIAELVTRHWWEPEPRRPWRLRTRYRPTDLLTASVRNPQTAGLSRLLTMLFSATTDTDDIESEAAHTDFGPATWLAYPVVHELVALKWWLQAAATTRQPTE
jgi:hypothetical protein